MSGDAGDRAFDAGDYRQVLGRLPTGIAVVTTALGEILHGMTANTFTSVSLDPFLVLICVDHTAYLHELLPQTGTFAVTVLAAEQQHESVWFASPRPSGAEFEDVAWKPAPVTGSPILVDGLAYVDCQVTDAHQAGDHSIFVGEVLDLGVLSDADPLIHFRGDYRLLR